MAEAGRDIKTPQPRERKRNLTGIATVLGIVVSAIAVIAFLGLPTPGEIQTKSASKNVTDDLAASVKDVATKLETHVASESLEVSKLKTDSAVHEVKLDQMMKVLDRLGTNMDVLSQNQITMMREVAVPEARIAKPRRQP